MMVYLYRCKLRNLLVRGRPWWCLVDGFGTITVWFSLPLGSEQCRIFGSTQKDTIIYELEMAAAVVASTLWCGKESNDLHTHFGDNDSVRFSFGCASGTVAKKLMEYEFDLEACSGTRTGHARVPTEANLSYYLSRMQAHDLLLEECNVSAKASAELVKLLQFIQDTGVGRGSIGGNEATQPQLEKWANHACLSCLVLLSFMEHWLFIIVVSMWWPTFHPSWHQHSRTCSFRN